MIDLQHIPFFQDIDPERVEALAETYQISAGEMLFAEGDAAQYLYILLSGKLMLSRDATPLGEARQGDLLDPIPVLGLLAYTQRAIALSDCQLLGWDVTKLLQIATFPVAVQRYLAQHLLVTQSRLSELEAPTHYYDDSAQPFTGPFAFPNTTMVIALCDANLDFLRPRLPDDLSIFRVGWRKHDSVFLALAEFRGAHPDSQPEAAFSYTETTLFVPVRYKRQLGFFPAYIYPSTYEPILLGREIYGFPKRFGLTTFAEDSTTLRVDGDVHYRLSHDRAEPTNEPRLIRAMSDWLGLEGRVTEAAFRIGDVLLDTVQVGLHRRIGVFNHKRVLSATATQSKRVYDINQLTQGVFTVLKWQAIEKLSGAELQVFGGPLRYADLHLREAYRTQLDMRLSTGRVLKDYQREHNN